METGGRLLCVLLLSTLCLAACASSAPKPSQPVAPTPAPAQPSPSPNPSPQPAQPAQEFVASEELYRQTFGEVQQVIAALTRIIAAGDYDQWLSYLTADYVSARSSSQFLAQASNAGVLKAKGIVLKNLKDYFDNVVVRSHLQATLDDIQFLDETHVKAIALVKGTPVILYYLVHEGGRWKVGIRQTEEN